jgi:hypothetical protein
MICHPFTYLVSSSLDDVGEKRFSKFNSCLSNKLATGRLIRGNIYKFIVTNLLMLYIQGQYRKKGEHPKRQWDLRIYILYK